MGAPHRRSCAGALWSGDRGMTECRTAAAAVSRHHCGRLPQSLTDDAGRAPRPTGRGAGIGGHASLARDPNLAALGCPWPRRDSVDSRGVDSLLQQREFGSPVKSHRSSRAHDDKRKAVMKSSLLSALVLSAILWPVGAYAQTGPNSMGKAVQPDEMKWEPLEGGCE